MKKQTKPEADSLLRTPRAKNKLGLKINKIAMPHDDLISAEKPHLQVVLPDSATDVQTNLTRDIQSDLINRPDPTNSISPTNDYAKVANSITREAVPERLFKGMSKNTYDALYLKTRGAINPARRIRATKSDLIRWAGVSDITIDKHIKHLKSVGLLKVEFIIGSHEGNWYEVFIPEEINPPNLPNQRTQPNIPKKVGYVVPKKVGGVGWVNPVENKDTYGFPKTSLKTNTNIDDEPFGAMLKILTEVCEKTSGKKSQKSDGAKWKELGELLAMELEIAAARTNSISNAPAFLTEHLRRRLLGKTVSVEEKVKAGKFTKAKKSNSKEIVEEYQAEALSKRGREAVLKTMREYIEKGHQEFVISQQESYTKDDWEWLMKQLEQENRGNTGNY
jgi:hypothetical protein